MKFTDTNNEKNHTSLPDKENIIYESTKPSIGDVDELIFPDDEPYYISER